MSDVLIVFTVFWVFGSISFLVADMGRSFYKWLRKEKKDMAQYPTPRSEYVDVVQRFERYQSMEDWFKTMHPEAFKEWCAVYDVERSVKDE